jgi:hypothetical protein
VPLSISQDEETEDSGDLRTMMTLVLNVLCMESLFEIQGERSGKRLGIVIRFSPPGGWGRKREGAGGRKWPKQCMHI